MNEPSVPLRPLGYVNKKILESAGDMGVPRVQKAAPTAVKEFKLSSSRPVSARKKVDVPDDNTRPLYSSFGAKSGASTFARDAGRYGGSRGGGYGGGGRGDGYQSQSHYGGHSAHYGGASSAWGDWFSETNRATGRGAYGKHGKAKHKSGGYKT